MPSCSQWGSRVSALEKSENVAGRRGNICLCKTCRPIKQSMKPITSAQQLQQRNSRNGNKYAIICKSGKSRTTERASSCRADAAGRLMLPVLLQRAFSCTVSDCECVWTHWAPCILWGICAVGRHVCAREWETEMRGSSLCWAVWVQVLINEEEWWLRLA